MAVFVRKIVIFLLLPIMIFVLSGCAKTGAEKELNKVDNNISIRIEGAVFPYRKQEIISSVAGYVENIYVKNGDRVKKGDLIYSLDKELLLLDIKNTKQEISSLRQIRKNTIRNGTVNGNIPAINLAAMELKKMALLRSKGYVNNFEENTYKKNYINAMYSNKVEETNTFEKIKNLNTEISNKLVALKNLQYKYKYSDVYSQTNGFVTGLDLNKRELIGSNRKICLIVNLDKIMVKAGFATGLLPYIHLNQKVKINFVTTPPYMTTSVIKKINPIIDPAFDRMTAEIEIPNNNYILQEGTRALVTIPLSRQDQKDVKKYFIQNKHQTILEVKSKI